MLLRQDTAPSSARTRLKAALALSLLAGLMLIVPLGIRVANARRAERPLPASYLPALEGPRERRAAFEEHRLAELRFLNPGYVVIGDSMAGTRIDERVLGELAGTPVAPLLQAGSGPAFWFLALKNWVIASGIQPRTVFIFFRDTNLTDVMFRLHDPFRWSLDLVAHDREEDLNAVVAARMQRPYYRVHGAIETVYQADRARQWAEPVVTAAPARLIVPSRKRRTEFLDAVNARFSLDHLRPMEAADLRAAEDEFADFERYLDQSVLPLMLRHARAAGITICFVRVQRRPIDNRPPDQSPAMQEYIAELRDYINRHGGQFRDDTGDPLMTLDMYEDGDHIARTARARYTQVFFERLRYLFR